MPSESWTTLGTIGGTASARIDGAGRVASADGSWSFGWTIGAEDRWHDPAQTANVRQSLLGNAPVVETRMRVPGGDIIHRAYALMVAGADGGSDWVVVEVENDSAVPVALAVTRPGTARVVLPREPSDVRAEGAELVFTLTHRATIRFLVGVAGAPEEDPKVDSTPPLDAVLSGWRTQLDRGARLVVPDPRTQDAIDATRAHLLVDSSRSVSPALAVVLDEFGLHGEARTVVARVVEYRYVARRGGFGDLASNASVVAAIARHQQLAPDLDFARTISDRFVAGVQQLLDAVRPRRLRRAPELSPAVAAALSAAPDFLIAVGETDAAATVTTALSDLASISADVRQESSQDPVAVVDAMVASASSTWTWTDADGSDRSTGESVRFAAAARRAVVEERSDGVVLVRDVPQRWIGQSLEAHEVPTRFGAVSFAVRWHGERPALLWEIDSEDTPVTITCGLDPSWSTDELHGETLLAAPAASAAIETAVDGPGAGDSFG